MTEKLERPKLVTAEAVRPFVIVALLAAVMWVEQIVSVIPGTHFDFNRWGIEPRRLHGLPGIVLAPFLHVGFGHLIGNTIPFLVLGGIIAVSGVKRYLEVTVLIALMSGAALWLLGPSNQYVVGASGVVFGYFTYLMARGFFDRRVTYIVIGAIVGVVYGSILWGLLPHPGISWQDHVFGALAGVATAYLLRTTKQHDDPKPAADVAEPHA